MVITVGIQISNERDEPVTIELPIGSVVEVDQPRVQNVALSEAYWFTLAPRSLVRKVVRGVCLNRDLSPPASVSGSLTPFRFDAADIDQDTVWERVSSPTSN
jgi:hypothetical protein